MYNNCPYNIIPNNKCKCGLTIITNNEICINDISYPVCEENNFYGSK